MSDKRYGQWFTTKKGNRARYYYKDNIKIGIQIAGVGYNNLATNEFFPNKSSERKIKTREMQKARRNYYSNKFYLRGYRKASRDFAHSTETHRSGNRYWGK